MVPGLLRAKRNFMKLFHQKAAAVSGGYAH